ncbi:MAG: hypothetical protein IJU72_06460, partial [Bacteroidales bacterium]|nr:hypothetical protein [Bacteroidales bacterium]
CGVQVRVLFGCSAVRLFGCSAVRLFGCSAVRLFGCSAVRLFGCSAVQSHSAKLHKVIGAARFFGQKKAQKILMYLVVSCLRWRFSSLDGDVR